MIALPARYSVTALLPGGGMSETALCFDAHLNRKVVYKAVKGGYSQKRILDELNALSDIRSDHVVQVFDVIKDPAGSIVGFIEEYVDGKPLDHADYGSFDDAQRVILDLASGVRDVHGHGKVHRDLKPDNMRIDANGILKLFDFGLAKPTTNSGTTSLYYSAGFTAPEAFAKSSSGLHEFDESVDVYAFGAVTLWLLNGGHLPACMTGWPISAPVPPIDFAAVKLPAPPSVAALLSATLAVDPKMRPSMDTVCETLKRHMLRDLHRLTLTIPGKVIVLDANRRTTPVRFGGATIEIQYDGYDFEIIALSGDVSINNMVPRVGQKLAGSVVIVLAHDGRRAFVTADLSHPEPAK